MPCGPFSAGAACAATAAAISAYSVLVGIDGGKPCFAVVTCDSITHFPHYYNTSAFPAVKKKIYEEAGITKRRKVSENKGRWSHPLAAGDTETLFHGEGSPAGRCSERGNGHETRKDGSDGQWRANRYGSLPCACTPWQCMPERGDRGGPGSQLAHSTRVATSIWVLVQEPEAPPRFQSDRHATKGGPAKLSAEIQLRGSWPMVKGTVPGTMSRMA